MVLGIVISITYKMNRRSSVQLRVRDKSIPECKRSRSLSMPKKDRTYERDRKRKYREKVRDGKSLERRGRKETVGLKNMNNKDLKEYERKRKKLYRERIKSEIKNADAVSGNSNEVDNVITDEDIGSCNQDIDNYKDVEFISNNSIDEEISNINKNPSLKKLRCTRILSTSIEESLSTLSPEEICDICTVLAQALPQGVKGILNDMGITISNIPKHKKRLYFSKSQILQNTDIKIK